MLEWLFLIVPMLFLVLVLTDLYPLKDLFELKLQKGTDLYITIQVIAKLTATIVFMLIFLSGGIWLGVNNV